MESIYLVGSEQVQSAARQMSEAADQMRRAANTLSSENEFQRRFLDDWLQRLAATFEDHITMLRQSQP